jgi:hypothetical protein
MSSEKETPIEKEVVIETESVPVADPIIESLTESTAILSIKETTTTVSTPETTTVSTPETTTTTVSTPETTTVSITETTTVSTPETTTTTVSTPETTTVSITETTTVSTPETTTVSMPETTTITTTTTTDIKNSEDTVAVVPMEESTTSSTSSGPILNRGTGAGGANTNLNGKTFEKKTENESRLLSNGFVRKQVPGKKGINNFYLEKVESPTKSTVYLTQGGLKTYFKHFFNKDMCRSPDEAYLFRNGDTYTLKVLEKKNQNTAGSVDTKLLAGKGFIDEYEYLLGDTFKVHYAFCISEFLKKDYVADTPKSKALRHINQKYGITVLFGDDENYYETLDAWINN